MGYKISKKIKMARRIKVLKKEKFKQYEIAEILTKEGYTDSKGDKLTHNSIGSINHWYKAYLKEARLKKKGKSAKVKADKSKEKGPVQAEFDFNKKAPESKADVYPFEKKERAINKVPYPDHIRDVIDDESTSQKTKNMLISLYYKAYNILPPSEVVEGKAMLNGVKVPALFIYRVDPDGTRGKELAKMTIDHAELLASRSNDIKEFCIKHSKKNLTFSMLGEKNGI